MTDKKSVTMDAETATRMDANGDGHISAEEAEAGGCERAGVLQ